MTTPKPYDILPDEEYPKKSTRITNNILLNVKVIQLESDWHSVNFVIEPDSGWIKVKEITQTHKVLATLEPNDTIEINFIPPDKLEK